MITPAEFKSRRTKVLDYLKAKSDSDAKAYRCVLRSGAEKIFSNDVHYPFRVNSDFYYLTDFREPDAVCVLDPHSDNPFTLYVQPIDPKHEIWDGPREGVNGAKKNFHADAAYDYEEFKDNAEPHSNRKSSAALDVSDLIHSLRSIKSEAEIALMQRSANIAVQAHRVAKEIITPGIYEYEIEAVLNQVFRSQGADGWAYPSIVASGENSCILHYIKNNKIIEKDDLILIDAGAEYNYYASDITRVHAASGTMSRQQQDIYDLVIAAQLKAIASIKPGSSLLETHDIASAVIGEGLADLGYIKDKNDPEQIKKYYMHSTGHSLGIDVHDVGVDKKTTKYVPGMVCTVEPGVYIRDKKIGVRIEDDIVVTKDGSLNLSIGMEK
jgi:Xaa-Pro aminopeptidase